jgi:hypothetical protein
MKFPTIDRVSFDLIPIACCIALVAFVLALVLPEV